MDSVSFKTGVDLSLTECTQSVPGLGSITSPQDAGYTAGPYTYGASGSGSIDQIIWQVIELAASGTLAINILSGGATNPLLETAQLDTVKEWAIIAYPTDNAAADTAPEGVTAAFSTTAAAAVGFAAAFTKTLVRGESFVGSNPAGRAVTGTPTITLTNLSASGKARVLLVLAGFKP